MQDVCVFTVHGRVCEFQQLKHTNLYFHVSLSTGFHLPITPFSLHEVKINRLRVFKDAVFHRQKPAGDCEKETCSETRCYIKLYTPASSQMKHRYHPITVPVWHVPSFQFLPLCQSTRWSGVEEDGLGMG